jgi:glucokinase
MNDYVIGVDIGATKIASGVLDKQGKIVATSHVPTLAQERAEIVLNQVFKSIDELKFDLSKVNAIGVCAPGPLRDGVIINPPNIPHWQNYPLAKNISEHYSLPVSLENDANAAAYAEMIIGSAKGYKNFIYVTVSTGIGTGIIIDGKIYRGKNGLAGEGGHVTINHLEEIDCNCGVPGCIESLASGTALAKSARKILSQNPNTETKIWELLETDQADRLNSITTKHISKAVQYNDKFSMDLMKDAAFKIGVWLGGIVSLLDPEVIIIGGGVMNSGDFFLNEIREVFPKFTINRYAAETPLLAAALKEHVGVYGAACVCYESEITRVETKQ